MPTRDRPDDTSTPTPLLAVATILDTLDADTIRSRIDTLAEERRGLQVLLRAVRRRQRATAPPTTDR